MKLTIEFKEDGKLVDTIEVLDSDWYLSNFGTYEEFYKGRHILIPQRWGYGFHLRLERPDAKTRGQTKLQCVMSKEKPFCQVNPIGKPSGCSKGFCLECSFQPGSINKGV